MMSGRMMKRARSVNARWKATRSERALGNGRAREERDDDEGRGGERRGDGTPRLLGKGDDREKGTNSREETMRQRVRFDRKFRNGDGWDGTPRYAYEDHEAHRDRSDDEAEARAKTRRREVGDEDGVGGVGRTWEWLSEDGRRRESSSGGDASEETKVCLLYTSPSPRDA